MMQASGHKVNWSVGRTLLTQKTRQWSAEQRADNDLIESRGVFSNFTAEDEGRSRELIATCEHPAQAAFIVLAVNAHESLVAALESARDYIRDKAKRDGSYVPTVNGGTFQAIEAALQSAKEPA